MGTEHPTAAPDRAATFFADLWAVLDDAPIRHTITVADRRVSLELAGSDLESRIMPVFAHLATNSRTTPDLTIRLWDSATTGAPLPNPPWDLADFPEGGEIRGPNTTDISIAYRFDPGSLSAYDRSRHRAVFWIEAPDRIPGWMTAAPLRTILPWFVADAGHQFVHGAAVGLGDRGILIAGAGGSGKSTSALTCLSHGFQYVGDDYVIATGRGVASMYGSGKVTDKSLGMLPHLRDWIINDDPAISKHVALVNRAYPEQMTVHLDLAAIVLPQVTDRAEPQLRPATAGTTLLALAPTTLFQLPGAGASAMRFMAELAGRVPSYHLELGAADRVPALLTTLLEDLQ